MAHLSNNTQTFAVLAVFLMAIAALGAVWKNFILSKILNKEEKELIRRLKAGMIIKRIRRGSKP